MGVLEAAALLLYCPGDEIEKLRHQVRYISTNAMGF